MHEKYEPGIGGVVGDTTPSDAGGITGGIIWWANSLCYGGVERQILATAGEFVRHSIPLSLLCHRLLPYRGDDFFLSQAEGLFSPIYDFGTGYASAGRKLRTARKNFRHALQSGKNPLAAMTAAGRAFQDGRTLPVAPAREALREGERLAAACPLPLSAEERAIISRYAAFFLEKKPRVLHVWNADHLLAPLGAVLAEVPKVVLGTRSLSPRSRFSSGFESIDDTLAHARLSFLLGFPAVIMTANSKSGADDYADWLGIDPGRIPVLYNMLETVPDDTAPGAGDTFRRALGIPLHAPVIGGLSRLRAVKDPLLWVAAALHVLEKRPDAYAVLGGDGDLLEQCRAAAAPFADRFRFPGRIDDVGSFYAACSVFLLTSHVEGLPNVLMEAQYAGVPVVSTHAGGAAETFVDGETGRLVKERSAEALAKAIRHVLEDQDWRRKAGSLAHAYSADTFSAHRVFAGMTALYAR